ncbi:restriction endonuclease subunit S [Geobacillus thermoleovorans]|uniref:Restriction modification system DNA specificity domain-containing protein n=4 Tax=Geobacillus thermoleovorans group TaxID=1505648 RepID=U2YDJ1_GEOKU|nr:MULTISPECIES: restriction endonuclease subunit S [Geobacillus]AUI38262.1 restriction endonuclease subunit S [[Bacillus] caldolyticus]QDY72117.1 restriction endonuclease subunit S [Geobacillus thermoleovorans]GAD15168.1 restriction modification system DNA specificity domain-containing protein [Geobacillus kaustophilus GBlys]GAJ60402.1 type I restriction-modification system S subunit [Geobacillus thermoleovorans B23]
MAFHYKKLGELVTIIGGGTPDRNKPHFWNGDINWISVKDLVGDTISSSLETITTEGLEKSSAKLIPKGNIILPTRMALGKVAINQIDVAINQDLKALIIKDNSQLDLYYLFYFLKSKSNFIESKGKGATVKGITVNLISNLEVPILPLTLQKKIASVLRKAQALINKRKAQIEALDQLTQSVFLEMFGDPVSNKTWERRPLKDIADVRDGTHDSPKYVPNGYPLVTSKNIKNGKIDLSNVNYISEEDFININKRSKVDIGDIIMPMIGTIGNPIIVDEQPNFAIKNVALIKFNNPLLVNIYLKYLLDSHYLDYILNKNKRGGTQKFLSLTDIRNMEIPLPPRDLQDKFSEIVKKIDSQKSILHKSLRELEKNFNSLMQRAFKGELFND